MANKAIYLLLITTCLIPSAISGDPRSELFDKLRKGNCESCRERLKTNVAEVLPRLSLIKQRILNALGKQEAVENTKTIKEPSNLLLPGSKSQESKSSLTGSGLNEIVSVSQNAGASENDTIIRFQVQSHSIDTRSEAVSASLMLFLDRKRRIRKGGRGKKVFIEISTRDTNDVNNDVNKWNVIASFRTRVKRRRWKSISLPLSIAQNLLLPNHHVIDLKVKCEGCGRLVDLVLDSRNAKYRNTKVSKRKMAKRQRTKRRKKTARDRSRKRANPMLIISTRYKNS